jgi:DNA-binding transcriptional regulator PaaX
MDKPPRFLFRPEYRWPKDKNSKPFFTVPAWWRRFLYHVLRPRDVTVYLYYLSVMNPAGVAWPARAQICSDLGVKDKDAIRDSVQRLVELGFLIEATEQDRSDFSMADRPMYQRPCVQFTVYTLLKEKKIDGRLFPLNVALRSEHDKATDSVVTSGIKTMLGDMHAGYLEALNSDRPERDQILTDVLKEALKSTLDRMKEAADKQAVATASRPINLTVVEAMPKNVQAAFRLEKASAQKRKRRKKGSLN